MLLGVTILHPKHWPVIRHIRALGYLIRLAHRLVKWNITSDEAVDKALRITLFRKDYHDILRVLACLK